MAFGTLDMALWLPRFLVRYPEVKIDLVSNDRFVDHIEEGFDIALRLARELPDSTLMAMKLAATNTMLVAAPSHEWIFAIPEGGRTSVMVRGSLQANTGMALRIAALACVGIATTTSFIVHEDLRHGTLVPELPRYKLRPRSLYAIYPHNQHLSPKVRAFIDFASEIYSSPDWT
jgi:DNA-binding transcriptional LysR family regulator